MSIINQKNRNDNIIIFGVAPMRKNEKMINGNMDGAEETQMYVPL